MSPSIRNEPSDSGEFQMIENLWKCAIKSVVPTNPADVVRLALCWISRRRGCLMLTRAQWSHITGFFEKGCSFYQTLAGLTHGSSTAMKHYGHVTSRGQTYMCVYIFLTSKLSTLWKGFLFIYLFISEWHCGNPLNVFVIIGPKVSKHTCISSP